MNAFKSLFIAFFVVITTMPAFGQKAQDISLDDVWRTYSFFARSVYGLRSMQDGEHYTTLIRNKMVAKFKYETGTIVDSVIDLTTLQHSVTDIDDYEFSPDETKLLVTVGTKQIYRHSFKANYYIYDIAKKKLTALSENGKQQLATFSPDASKVAFVRDNNLFIKDLSSGEEAQVTTDGKKNEIINGAPDWVYEEEFAFSKAFAWSPDGKNIAFYRFDESDVRQFNMTMYGDLYPDWYKFKYPKAGEKNATVQIHVYNLSKKSFKKMDIGNETDQYIPRIKWTKNPAILSMLRMNRLQNQLDILMADVESGQTKVIYTEKNKRYVTEPSDDMLTFLDNGKEYLFKSEKDGYMHIYLFDINGKEKQQITKGEWDVISILGVDKKDGRIYYQSAEPTPMQRGVFSINMKGKKKKRLNKKDGTTNIEFSNGFKYYISFYSSINEPTHVTLHDKSGKLIRELRNNERVDENMNKYGCSPIEFFDFKTSEDVKLNGWIIKPKDFDPNKKYPVFMFVYGGPGSQTVLDNWNYRYGWYQMLAQKGYIVVSVDNRGTGARGEEFKKMTYGQLGKYETIDQIEAAKYFAAKTWVDKNRIGIFGWSYGGYMSTLCITKGADIFKMAIAVAPVTNWRYYDSIYTERYMGLPQDNADGYDNNSPINHVEKLKGNYLLIHGLADDNVHFQNSAELLLRLYDTDKQFDQHFYPNKNHGIYGGNTTYHLYTKLTNYILGNL